MKHIHCDKKYGIVNRLYVLISAKEVMLLVSYVFVCLFVCK